MLYGIAGLQIEDKLVWVFDVIDRCVPNMKLHDVQTTH